MSSHPAVLTKPFDPTAIGLPQDFVLTDYTRLKGCSCKIPQVQLLRLLNNINISPGKKELADVGMDCSIVPLKSPLLGKVFGKAAVPEGKTDADVQSVKIETTITLKNGTSTKSSEIFGNTAESQPYLVSTTDFFFPSVDDPFLQGQIGCANVLSDLYSMGIEHCDTLLMLLAASIDMEEEERFTSTLEMMKGFAQKAKEGDTSVTGGQSVLNPWPLIGGVSMTVVPECEMSRPDMLVPGDVLVLTKPLGTQLAVNLKQWARRPSPLYKHKIEGKMTIEEIDELYSKATGNMARLNRTGARLMQKYQSHGCTDVTGFGLLGHAKNLSQAQQHQVLIEITVLPIFKGAVLGEKLLDGKHKLFEGTSAETSGGLLVALKDLDTANAFIHDIQGIDKEPAWIVGKVLPREAPDCNGIIQYARVASNAAILEI